MSDTSNLDLITISGTRPKQVISEEARQDIQIWQQKLREISPIIREKSLKFERDTARESARRRLYFR
jgi:hypothetical protein